MTAVKGPSRERQSPPEHGLHVLGSDRLCHGYPQQTGTARHPAPSLPWSRGKTPLCSLLFHPVQLHAVQRVGVAVECEGGGKPPGPNHITHHRQIMPRSDKHVIKRSGGKDNYVHWKWNNKQVFLSCSNNCPLLYRVCVSSYGRVWYRPANQDPHKSKFHTLVYFLLVRNSILPDRLTDFSQLSCFCSSIKPFTQQAYPIQPAVTTAISSKILGDYFWKWSWKVNPKCRNKTLYNINIIYNFGIFTPVSVLLLVLIWHTV